LTLAQPLNLKARAVMQSLQLTDVAEYNDTLVTRLLDHLGISFHNDRFSDGMFHLYGEIA
jgi:hypothetical protein